MEKETQKKTFHFNDLLIELHPDVYEPAEDSYLLIEALKINPNIRIAILGKPEVIYGLARMWETYAYNLSEFEDSCQVFRDRDDLIKWIKSESKDPP